MKSIPIFEYKCLIAPKFTIAIPTFKRELTLKDTIESAFNQFGFIDYEVIVLDNNPDRNCATEILLSQFKDLNFSYYKNERNIGMVANWNQLYVVSKGDYVVMLHDDDILSPYFLKSVNFFINKFPNVSIFYPPFLHFSEDSDFLESKDPHDFSILDLEEKDFLNGNIIGPPLGMIIKRVDFFKTLSFREDFYPSMDLDFYVNSSRDLNCIKIFGPPLAFYRIENNISQSIEYILKFIDKDLEIKNSILEKKIINIFKPYFKFYFEIFSFKYFNMMCALFKINSNREVFRKRFPFRFGLFKLILFYYPISIFFRISFRVRRSKVLFTEFIYGT